MSHATAAASENPAPPGPRSFAQLRAAEATCTRCPLYANATQVVPGEGLAKAPVLMVGEQPGDREDIVGRPFVGPAGRILDEALVDAGIDRATVFVTNAVKHFKHEMRGKRRLHKKPNAYEIERCRWWLDMERKLLKPEAIVALGATAARSILGRPVTLAQQRGHPLDLPGGTRLIVTIHPSYLLRIRQKADWRAEYARFVDDLSSVGSLLGVLDARKRRLPAGKPG
jgi:uracil-DNA glycosylase